MNDTTTDGAMRVSGGMAVDDLSRERMIEITAELHAHALVEALASAVAGDPHWRRTAQALLRDIANGVPPRHD